MPPIRRLLDWRAPVLLLAVVAAGGAVGAQRYQAHGKAQVAKALTGGDPSRAPWLLVRYGCAGCHTIAGLAGADGRVGPPLEQMAERVFIGGTAPNSADNLVAWLREPQRFAPHAAMPPPGLNEQEARDIAAYLYAH
jgi:cytochrome c2